MIDVILKENERIDDLEINGFRIIQNPFCFCFGMDAVLLANFARISPKADVIDLGTGTGIVPLLLAAKSKGQSWTGLEIQENMVDMARRSVEMNEATEKVNILQGDLKAVREMFKPAQFGAVTSNPPYMKENSGLKNPSDTIYISRHEVSASLEDVVSAASYLLKTNGTFTMVHRPSRLPEIMEMMVKYRLEPKRMQLVQPTVDKEPNLVLIEGVKEAGRECRILPTLAVYDNEGNYTEELLRYYGKEK
ncbi:MAG: tRNA1(Val) (adenine(37)-N6)-methyltransferase [Eubacterium sp.]|nr:tRNA1(Val) (adenine(37)-N6)-methyltransferase [Eubacterium sp.]